LTNCFPKTFGTSATAKRKEIIRRADRFRPLREWVFIDRLLERSDLRDVRDLIAEGRDEANYREGQHVNRRYEGLDALLGNIEKEKNARITELGTESVVIPGAGPDGGNAKVSKAFLMTASIGLEDPRMRVYLLYGRTFFSDAERSEMARAVEAARGNREAAAAVRERIEEMGRDKEKLLRAAVKDGLTGADLAIRGYIKDDFSENFERINEAAYAVDNSLMPRMESYLPIFTRNRETDGSFSFNGITYTYSKPEDGFLIERKTISPWAVGSMETDIIKLFYRGVADQEHFAAFAPFIKELNAVFGKRGAEGREITR
jgi:hypothetical protein